MSINIHSPHSEHYIDVILKIPKDKVEILNFFQNNSPEVIANYTEITLILFDSLQSPENQVEINTKLNNFFDNFQYYKSKSVQLINHDKKNKNYYKYYDNLICFLQNQDNYPKKVIDIKNYLQSTGYWECSLQKYKHIRTKLNI